MTSPAVEVRLGEAVVWSVTGTGKIRKTERSYQEAMQETYLEK